MAPAEVGLALGAVLVLVGVYRLDSPVLAAIGTVLAVLSIVCAWQDVP